MGNSLGTFRGADFTLAFKLSETLTRCGQPSGSRELRRFYHASRAAQYQPSVNRLTKASNTGRIDTTQI